MAAVSLILWPPLDLGGDHPERAQDVSAANLIIAIGFKLAL